MKPFYEDEYTTIYHADLNDVVTSLPAGFSLVTDPPYGIASNSGRRLHAYRDHAKSKGRIGGDNAGQASEHLPTTWDDEAMSEQTWLMLKRSTTSQVVWGFNHLFDALGKPNRLLVWDKKCRNGWEDTFSDCELAWCSEVGPDRMYRHLWMGMLRQEKEARVHPTQKPLALMRWSLDFVKPGPVLDPYMGSGTTLVAAKLRGRKSVGVELSEDYCRIAANRVAEVEAPKFKRLKRRT